MGVICPIAIDALLINHKAYFILVNISVWDHWPQIPFHGCLGCVVFGRLTPFVPVFLQMWKYLRQYFLSLLTTASAKLNNYYLLFITDIY